MLFVVLSALMVTLASAQYPFAPHYPAYPGNFFQQQQHQYQDNRGIIQSLIPSAFVKTTTVNSTLTVSVTCTVSAATGCRRRRDADEVVEQFAPSEVVPVETSQLPEIERDARQAYPYVSPYSYQGYPYGFHQQALQSAFDEPNTYQVPYVPSFQQQEQVAERQFYLRTTTKTNWIGAVTTITSSPSCFDAKAKLLQCPAA